MHPLTELSPQAILDSMGDGVYVTDTSRKIVYWNQAAEAITGWPAKEIVGKHCYDDTLCHIDKDGHELCGNEYCPLHRSIVTGQTSSLPFVVFAQQKRGDRVPLQVSVAPIRDKDGEVVGGVETFRDLSYEFRDIERAKRIQSLSLQQHLPEDPRINFNALYVPHDIIGGDYYAVAPLDDDRYGFLLTDITGHGVPAALYTMYLNLLWDHLHPLLSEPCAFAKKMNEQLCHLIREDQPFAAGMCGVFDLRNKSLHLVGAGNPDPLLIRRNGIWEHLKAEGLPWGIMTEPDYEGSVVELHSGDCILFYSDGAVEITMPQRNMLGVDGLMEVLQDIGYPDKTVSLESIEQTLLKKSDCIRFDDDLTFLEVRIS